MGLKIFNDSGDKESSEEDLGKNSNKVKPKKSFKNMTGPEYMSYLAQHGM